MANGIETAATWDARQQLLRCRTPAVASAKRAEATVTTGLDNHTLASGDGVAFTFYQPAVVEYVWPAAGPASGDTKIAIRGSGLAVGMGPFLCRFNRTEVRPATLELLSRTMRCRTPESAAGIVLVEVSLNGQQYHGELAASHFAFHPPPQVLSISPASGTVLGQTTVTIAGSGFELAGTNQCRWNHVTTKVSSINASHVECPTPRRRNGISRVEVTLNGQQYTAGECNFSHHLQPHVQKLSLAGEIGEPDSFMASKITLPRDGDVMVSIWGMGFMGGTDYRCKINENEPIEATYDARSDCVKCWSDSWVDGTNFVEVTLNGREYTSNGAAVEVNYYWLNERYMAALARRNDWAE
jgi:hypothetical protein